MDALVRRHAVVKRLAVVHRPTGRNLRFRMYAAEVRHWLGLNNGLRHCSAGRKDLPDQAHHFRLPGADLASHLRRLALLLPLL